MKRGAPERLAAALLRLYPAGFRRRFAAEIVQHARTESSSRPAGELLRVIALDALRTLPREWREALHPAGLSPRRAARGEPVRHILRDLGHASRLLLKTPAFTTAAVATLALGIGATTAIFTLVDATLLRPVRVRAPHELVQWSWTSSYPDYLEYARRTDVFQGVAAVAGGGRLNFAGGDRAELVSTHFVTGNAFDLLGIGAAEGRLIAPADDTPGGPLVAVLGHDYWRTRFGGDASVVGRTFRLNGRPITILGVTERGFRGTRLSGNAGLYVPVAVASQVRTGFFARVNALTARGLVWLDVICRLRPDVTAAQAEAAMTTLYAQLHPRGPGKEPALVELEPIETRALGGGAQNVRQFVIVLLGVVALTLLVGCANLANLLLAKAAARRREIGVRLALGATRWRVVRLLLVESVLLSLVGGAAGLAVARMTLSLLGRYQLPGGIEIAELSLDVDRWALAVAFGLSVATGILFGTVPAVRAARLDVLHSLRDQSRSATPRSAVRGTLLAAQIAMSLMLLAGAGLFARSLRATLDQPLGFDPGPVVKVSVNVGLARYDEARATEFYRAALDRVSRLPQVEAAAWAGMIPTRTSWVNEVSIEPAPGAAAVSTHVNMSHVGPGYFRTLGTRVIAGREFDATDSASAPGVAVVSEALARKVWGTRSPLGSRVRLGKQEATVVGVVENVVDRTIGGPGTPFLYMAFNQSLSGPESIATDAAHLFVRARVDAGTATALVAEQVRAIDPGMPVYDVEPLADRVAALLVTQRMALLLFALFSAVAICLAAVGVYGVASYVTALRTREIGVRVALGASQAAVRRLILVQSAWPIGVGVVAGLGLALYASRLIRAFLLNVTSTDPATFAAVVGLLTTIALAATYVPARRASRVNPVVALRDE